MMIDKFEKSNTHPEIAIMPEVYNKLIWFTQNYKEEVGVFLLGKIVKNTILVYDFIMPKQDVSSGSVDTSTKAQIDLRKQYGDKCLDIIGHFHSHNTLSSFWSQDDEDFIKQFTENRQACLYIVGSKQDGLLVRLELNVKGLSVTFDGLPFKVYYETKDYKEELEKMIKENVTESKVRYRSLEDSLSLFVESDKENKTVTVKGLDKQQKEFVSTYLAGGFRTLMVHKGGGLVDITIYANSNKEFKRLKRDALEFVQNCEEEHLDMERENINYNLNYGGYNGFYSELSDF